MVLSHQLSQSVNCSLTNKDDGNYQKVCLRGRWKTKNKTSVTKQNTGAAASAERGDGVMPQ